jgi:Methyltransferase domain
MRTFLRRVNNALWYFTGNPLVAFPLSEFAANATNELRSVYRGRSADIFFANEGQIVHKWLHYLPIYDQLLGPYVGSKVKMLEIGVFKGGSLGLWRKLLGDEAVIFGIDINPDCAAYDGDYARVRIGSQDDPHFLRRVVSEMGGLDVVLDDGSHVASHQRASFNVLFSLLSEGGLYLIEDLHTSYWPDWEGGLKRRGTAVEFLKDKVDEIHRHYRTKGLNTVTSMPSIESIQFFDSIAAVRKCKQLPRYHVMVPSPVGSDFARGRFHKLLSSIGFCWLQLFALAGLDRLCIDQLTVKIMNRAGWRRGPLFRIFALVWLLEFLFLPPLLFLQISLSRKKADSPDKSDT